MSGRGGTEIPEIDKLSIVYTHVGKAERSSPGVARADEGLRGDRGVLDQKIEARRDRSHTAAAVCG